MSLRRTLLRSATQFSLATLAAQATGLLRTYAAAKLLGPTIYGTWLGLRLIVDYGNNLHLGAISGMHREVPLSRGQGDERSAGEARSTAFAFVLLTGSLGALGCAGAALFVAEPMARHVLFAIAAVLLLNQLRAYYGTLLKADNRFREASVGSGLGSAAAIASLPIIYWLGMPGFVWGLVGMLAVETAYLAARAGVPRVELSRPMLRRLLAFGFPTTLIVFADTLLSSIDRTVILEKLDAEQLGYYSMAFIGATFLAGVATVPTAVLYPRLSECYGRTGRAGDLVPWVGEPLRLAGIGFAILIGAMALAVPAAAHVLLPKYVPGILAAQIALFGHYAFSVVAVACNAFLALNRMRLYGAITLAAAGATYLLARGMVHLAPGLPAVAVGCSLGMFLFLLLGVCGAYYAMERPLAEGLRAFAASLWPIAYAGAAVLAIEYGLHRWTRFAHGSIARAAIAEALFAVAALPWLASVRRRLES